MITMGKWTVSFLAVEVWETVVTNGVKKINRKILNDQWLFWAGDGRRRKSRPCDGRNKNDGI